MHADHRARMRFAVAIVTLFVFCGADLHLPQDICAGQTTPVEPSAGPQCTSTAPGVSETLVLASDSGRSSYSGYVQCACPCHLRTLTVALHGDCPGELSVAMVLPLGPLPQPGSQPDILHVPIA
jgi:hypothetical protein